MTSAQATRAPAAAPRDSDRVTALSHPVDTPRWPLVAVAIALSALAVWIISPRFGIDAPSLVDDWAAISRSPDQVRALVRLENVEPDRFRPSWIAWNYVQWHTLDGPHGLVGPNTWNVVRLLVFVLGMTLLTAVLLPRARGVRESVINACLAGLPAFAVITVPKFARDFASFGPQEPLLVGGLALGAALLVLVARSLLADEAIKPVPIALLGAAGCFFWLVGAYQKEVAPSAIPLLAAALWVERSRLSRWRNLRPPRKRALVALGLVTALPLLHVAVETARIALRGDLVYGAQVDSGAGIWRGVRVLYDWSHEAMPATSRYLLVGSVVLVVVAAVVRRRLDLLALGALASGTLAIVFAAQSGVAATRYYIPMYALFAVALSLSLARLPEFVRAAGVLVVFFAFMPPGEPHAEVSRWSDEEQQHAEIVSRVAALERSGCTVAAAGLDLETGIALPVIVGLERPPSGPSCIEDGAYFVLPPSPGGSLSLLGACAPGGLEPLAAGRVVALYRCTRLRADAGPLLVKYRLPPVAT